MISTRQSLLLTSLIFVLLLCSLVFMSHAINNSANFDKLYSMLFVINSLALLCLVYLIGQNIHRLIRQLKEHRPGARLTLRMVTTFTLLSVVPLVIVFWFSTDFIHRSIDNWFDIRIENALTDSLELSKESLSLRMRDLLRTTEQMAEDLTDSNSATMSPLNLSDLQGEVSTIVMNTDSLDTSKLDSLRLRNGAEELAILTKKGRVIATSSAKIDLLPNIPGNSTLLQLRQGRNYIGLEPIRDAGLFIRAVVNLPNAQLGGKKRMIQALYPVATRINSLAENVQNAFSQYQELNYLRKPLKMSFTMTLTLVLLFSIFSAVLAAFHSARKLAAPIHDLAEGTRRITQGDYGKQLQVSSTDDLGFLVQSFNQMSHRIAVAQHELDAQRSYLQAVLSKLSSGVLTFDADLNLKTANESANQILQTDFSPYIGGNLEQIPKGEESLVSFYEGIEPQITQHSDDWQQQVVLFGGSGRKVLMCSGTALESLDSSEEEGHVIVFDDITALLQGQRDAAWSEVARRLAHEIKNPLTPIQLSAERLRHKYLNKMPANEAETLDRLTNTIVQQVDTMKEMVNTFSDYARPPQIKPAPLNINPMIEEVTTLYRQMNKKVNVELRLEESLPLIEADHNRLRQILNNLIKNAIEATSAEEHPQVQIYSNTLNTAARELVEVKIVDNGPGFPEDLIGSIFEPYVTTKARGTGLGLAIVKKIVEEHGGLVAVENNHDRGGTVVIRLPVVMENQNVHSINEARKNLI